MLDKELAVALGLARDAGKAIMTIFDEGFEIEEKSTGSLSSEPVTIADRISSKIIVAGLTSAFPGDAVLSEEEPDDTERRLSKKRVWMVDPLDGTRGFIEKAADFAVQIGLTENGLPILGVVFQPVKDVLYFGFKGAGAFVTKDKKDPERLRVSGRTDFRKMTVAVSRTHRSPKMGRLVEHFGFDGEFPHGSVGLKVGLLAEKKADVYIHLSPHTKFWDTAAPQIILEEAGGFLTDIFGGPITYDTRDVQNHNGILAGCGEFAHHRAVEHLRPILSEFGRLRVTSKHHLRRK